MPRDDPNRDQTRAFDQEQNQPQHVAKPHFGAPGWLSGRAGGFVARP